MLRALEKILNLKLLQNTFFRFGFVLIILIQIGALIGGYYFAAQKNSVKRYIPYMLFHVPALFAVIVMLELSKNKYKTDMDFPISDPSIHMRMESEWKFITIANFGITLISVLSHTINMLSFFGDEDTYSHIALIHKWIACYSPTVADVTQLLGFMSLNFGQLYGITYISYMAMVFKGHLYLLIDRFQSISADFQHLREEQMANDEDYQNEVYRRLIWCTENHINVIILIRKISERLKLIIICMPIGSLAPVGVAYFIINEISPKNNFRMILVTMEFVLIVAYLCKMGQEVEDGFDYIWTTITEVPWINWNKKNKQALLILMTNAKTHKLSAFNTVYINYRLLLTFYRCVYTLVTVLF